MARSPSSMPSSMLTSRMLAPLRTCSSATSRRGAVVAGLDQLGELGRAGDVGALADHEEVRVGPDGERLEAAPVREAVGRRRPARRQRRATASAMARMCSGVVPQQPPTRFTRPASANSRSSPRRRLGLLVVAAERVRQAGVRVAAHERRRDRRELGQVRPHLARAERAVDADGERPRVRDRGAERVDRLPGQRAAALVGDGDRDDDRQPRAAALEHLVDREQRRLGVQRVEDGLDQQDVDAAVEEPAHLLGVGVAHLVEGDRPRRSRSFTSGEIESVRFVGPMRAGHEARRDRACAPSSAARTPRARAAPPRRSARRRPPRGRSRPARSPSR